MPKTNYLGEYLPFAGITVVSDVEEDPVWEEIYNSLNNDPILRQYYAPIPYQAYHMTMFNMFTQDNRTNQAWDSYLVAHLPHYQHIKHQLEERANNPIVSYSKNLHYHDAIQIMLSLPKKQHEQLTRIATDLGYRDYIPACYHITLAYQYKPFDNHHIKEIIKEKLQLLCNQYLYSQREIFLTPPTLRYFHDMTAFHVWDALSNPFKTPRSSPMSIFTRPTTPRSRPITPRPPTPRSPLDARCLVEEFNAEFDAESNQNPQRFSPS